MNHMTVAASEQSFQAVFNRPERRISRNSRSGGGDFGPFSASYDVGVRLEGGTIDLQNNNTVLLSELDIVYDPLVLRLGSRTSLKSASAGSASFRAPSAASFGATENPCIFSADPDIQIDLIS